MSAFGPVALFLASLMLLVNAGPLRAQDLDAGKSGQKLFATNCTACHRTPRGLAKQTNRLSLFYFLRQHYTASQTSAGELAAYLVATDSGASRAKPKPAAAGQGQASGSWWSTFIGGQKAPAASKRRKKVPSPSATPRPSAGVTNR